MVSGFRLGLTMIGGNQLIHAVVWLPVLNCPSAIVGALWKLIGPVHPVNPGVDVVLITCTYLENTGNPIVIRLLPWLHRLTAAHCLLPLDARVVGNVNETFAEVLDAVDCQAEI